MKVEILFITVLIVYAFFMSAQYNDLKYKYQVLHDDYSRLSDKNDDLNNKIDFVIAENDDLQQSYDNAQTAKKEYDEINIDALLIASVIYHEARGESDEGQIAVANVILNRVSNNDFSDTVESVITKRGAFSGYALSDTSQLNLQCYNNALKAINGDNQVPQTCVYFLNKSTAKDTAFVDYLEHNYQSKQIGNHTFYYL